MQLRFFLANIFLQSKCRQKSNACLNWVWFRNSNCQFKFKQLTFYLANQSVFPVPVSIFHIHIFTYSIFIFQFPVPNCFYCYVINLTSCQHPTSVNPLPWVPVLTLYPMGTTAGHVRSLFCSLGKQNQYVVIYQTQRLLFSYCTIL